MDPLTRRILTLICGLFQRLEAPERQWLVSRLSADDRALNEGRSPR